MKELILRFDAIRKSDLSKVGGKNASLGEMYSQLADKGIKVPPGFALTADAYRCFLEQNKLSPFLNNLLDSLDKTEFTNLSSIGDQARKRILSSALPDEVVDALTSSYQELIQQSGQKNISVAVRSSATAEDLPSASFAGRMESYLHISGIDQLKEAVLLCYASLYTDRAIKYRVDMNFMNTEIAISAGIQQMVRSDLASSGVAFTVDPDSGFNQCIVINGTWGLGENIVQGRVTPDEWILFKPTLRDTSLNPLLKKKCGEKESTLVYSSISQNAQRTTENTPTKPEKRSMFSLNESEVIQLARWCLVIEEHYGVSMDIEWAKDGISGDLFIVQARPETVHSGAARAVHRKYTLHEKGDLLVTGIALGDKIAAGRARILLNPEEGNNLQPGEILITDITNPDWDPILKKAAAIVTNKGGRTSHAAIVARELGTVAIVGSQDATTKISDGQEITVSCAEGKKGHVYNGIGKWEIEEEDTGETSLPHTAPMLILADPDRAFEMSRYPQMGVGLMRLEFAISNSVRIHPLALCEPDKVTDTATNAEIKRLTSGYDDPQEYFVDKLSEAVSLVAAAFHPNEVIVRLSDFKSNEYANLLGGSFFEPHEENPMIGLRGASRYYSDFYRKGFALECRAMKKVREETGLRNVKLMIPFCRAPEEGKRVLEEMQLNGLVRGENGLEIYVMIEIPSNVLLADEFASLFDGFSIGSNDLTQLTLGLDRDSPLISYLFNEENAAVTGLIRETIRAAHRNGIRVGLCGQAPSDLPAFARILVEEGIDSISFNPDALLSGIKNIAEAERVYQP